jgi:hypothetical protein
MELLKHVTSTIKILTLVSRKEQSSYVSTWSEILSVCARELKHGALIWTQSLQKDVHDQILSKPQGTPLSLMCNRRSGNGHGCLVYVFDILT